jgi:hypothetical protein
LIAALMAGLAAVFVAGLSATAGLGIEVDKVAMGVKRYWGNK